ncbi:unnamed protein product [Musa textilis]
MAGLNSRFQKDQISWRPVYVLIKVINDDEQENHVIFMYPIMGWVCEVHGIICLSSCKLDNVKILGGVLPVVLSFQKCFEYLSGCFVPTGAVAPSWTSAM